MLIAYYPTLAAEIAKRGIKKIAIARQLGISERTLYNKLTGKAKFTWPEVLAINSCFFPDYDPTILFSQSDSPKQGSYGNYDTTSGKICQ